MNSKVKITIFLVSAVLLFSFLPVFAQGTSRDASDYLLEYALGLYAQGDIADAIHEAKKSLMADPDNCAARKLLRKLISGYRPSSRAPLELYFLASEGLCPGKKILFGVRLKENYFSGAVYYRWDFGDGTVIEDGPAVTHAYARGSAYRVKVIALDKCGGWSEAIDIRLNNPPVAKAGANMICCLGKESVFDGSLSFDSDGDELTYLWDFGDGQKASGAKVAHAYTRLGRYSVILKVSDNSGTLCDSSLDSFMVDIAPAIPLALR